jgi:hypothetical protein
MGSSRASRPPTDDPLKAAQEILEALDALEGEGFQVLATSHEVGDSVGTILDNAGIVARALLKKNRST